MYVVELEVFPKTLTVTNETESIELRCEMSGYIEPDGNLQWIRNGQRVTDDSDKYEIHFEEGNRSSVLSGEETLSRLSVLVVLDFVLQSDAGCYECKTLSSENSASVYVGTGVLATG